MSKKYYRDPEFDDIEDSEEWDVVESQEHTASKIVALLESSNISRSEFAKLIGTTPAYISKILRGDANLTISSMVKISRALKCRININFEPIEKPQTIFAYSFRPSFLYVNGRMLEAAPRRKAGMVSNVINIRDYQQVANDELEEAA